MTLSRIIRAVKGKKYSLMHASHLTKTFVLGDVISFSVQSGSAGLMFQSGTVRIVGEEEMVVAGLIIQIVTAGLFALTAFALR
jgi:hypothetical protein